jgi:hypothetical protein
MAAVIIGLSISNIVFIGLYRGITDEYSSFKSTVEKESELLRLDNERQVQAVTEAARQLDAEYAAVRKRLNDMGRVVRVRDTCSGTGEMPGLSANATSVEGLHVPQSGLGAERVIAVEECETRLNWSVEDAATIEWMKAWAERTHEASK